MRGSYLTVAITLTCFQCDEELAFQLAAHAQFFVERLQFDDLEDEMGRSEFSDNQINFDAANKLRDARTGKYLAKYSHIGRKWETTRSKWDTSIIQRKIIKLIKNMFKTLNARLGPPSCIRVDQEPHTSTGKPNWGIM